MTRGLEVSVVMGVHNSAPTLRRTLDSVLEQEDVEMELIAIDDGSEDGTFEILREAAAADPRLTALRQENEGLTRTLIRGCELASGRYIARQDAGGDISLPGRLRAQADHLDRHADTVLVSVGTRFVGPGGELLYENVPADRDATGDLEKLDVAVIRGPSHHGATMFRREEYLAVGGYRAQFAVAQDLDLWLRLVERGRHRALPKPLYEAAFTPDSITATRRGRQFETAKLILECARRRRAGRSEEPILENAAALGARGVRRSGRVDRSAALYFIGSCLESRSPKSARRYYRQSLAEFPLNLKSLTRLLSLSISR